MSKTRNERRREQRETIFTVFCVVAVFLLVITLLCGMVVKALECPAEQPITYEQHMERFGGVNA